MKNLVTLVALLVICTALIPVTAVAEAGPTNGSFTVTYTGGVVGNPQICCPNRRDVLRFHLPVPARSHRRCVCSTRAA